MVDSSVGPCVVDGPGGAVSVLVASVTEKAIWN